MFIAKEFIHLKFPHQKTIRNIPENPNFKFDSAHL